MEGIYAVDGNPIVSMMAEEGIRSLYESLPRLAEDGGDDEARTQALYGCWLAGMVLGSASVALHHKLCHTLGGRFDMPHAETHRSEEHTSELQSLMRISYAVFCLKKKKQQNNTHKQLLHRNNNKYKVNNKYKSTNK